MFEYSHCMHICAYFCKNVYIHVCLYFMTLSQILQILTFVLTLCSNYTYQCEISNILRNSSQLYRFILISIHVSVENKYNVIKVLDIFKGIIAVH